MTGDILIAPFSNSAMRDWPAAHFTRLIDLLAQVWTGQGMIRVIGTRNQALRACEIVRALPSDRVVNDCGRLAWSAVSARLQGAACVIGNNSGVAHLAAHLGAPTVCIFGGAHQRTEWRPTGFNVAVVSRALIATSVAQGRAADCPPDPDCLAQIAPEAVMHAALSIMARMQAAGGDDGRRADRRPPAQHSMQDLVIA